MKLLTALLAGLALVWQANRAYAQSIIWNESVNGPLSNNFESPTQLGFLQLGSSSLNGASELNGSTFVGDYFTFSVDPSMQISSIQFSVNRPVWVWLGNPSFSGGQIGFAINPINGDLLSQFGLTSVGTGTYGMYVENHDSSSPSVANYSLSFGVQAVPEPGTLFLFAFGIGMVVLARKSC